jgi:formate dehydrogenase maturation protein FdhE
MKFWYAVSLLNAGRTAAAMPVLEKIIAAEPAWRELLRRLVAAQLLEVDEPVLARIEMLGLQTEETE